MEPQCCLKSLHRSFEVRVPARHPGQSLETLRAVDPLEVARGHLDEDAVGGEEAAAAAQPLVLVHLLRPLHFANVQLGKN